MDMKVPVAEVQMVVSRVPMVVDPFGVEVTVEATLLLQGTGGGAW
jgi:hypothetical protein